MKCIVAFALLTSAAGFVRAPRTLPVPSSLRARTDSGIEYTDKVVGDGRSPSKGDFVSVVYETRVGGRCIDPKIDKSSLQYTSDGELVTSFKNRGMPWAEFQVGRGRVIAGWDEIVQSMKVGGTRTCKLPAALAYGDEGSPDGVIKPGTDVEFTIELVSIDSNANVIGLTAKAFQFIAATIAANGVCIAVTGHELREYLAGTV